MDSLTVGKACKITTGKLDSNHAVKGGAYPFFTCAAQPDSIDSFAFDDDVVLVAGNNASGNFHVSRYKGKFNAYQRTYVLTAKQGHNIDYIYYSMKLELKRLKEKSQGSQTKFLTMPILTGIALQDLDYGNQGKIASVLAALDTKIHLNNRINAELEAMAKTLYDYWFVQFDFPDENGKPYKSSGGKMEYNPTLKRHIPAGWECKAIPDLLTIRTGKEDANFASEKGIYPFFTCGEEMLYCDIAVFSGKAILLAGNGNFAVRVYDGEFNAYQRTYVLIPENEHYYSVVYYAVRDKIKTLTKGSRGSIIKFITKGDIEDIKLALPEEGLLLNCFEMLNNVAEKISINSKENQQLTQLRDWLLPMLMNGQVKVA